MYLTQRIVFLFGVLVALIIGGCSIFDSPREATSGGPREAVETRWPMEVVKLSKTIATRSFLVRTEVPNEQYRVKGFVIFNARPSTHGQYNRYFTACVAYMHTLEDTDSYPEHLDLLPTYWPIETELSTKDCDEMLVKYDYVRASQIRSRYRTEIGSGEGPFLLAAGSGEIMIIDMSIFSDSDVYRAMRIWKEQICINPENWEPNLSLVKFREAFRSMLQAYGESILKYFG